MRVDGRIFLEATAVVIPDERQHIDQALTRGFVSAKAAAKSEISDISVASNGQTAEELALIAGHEVLRSADIAAADIDFLAHASIAHGLDDWTIAPRLSRLLGANRAVSMGVRQMSNGGAMAVQVAIAQMIAETRFEHGLVLTGDVAGQDASWRWQLHMGAALADSATALLLSRTTGALSVRSVASCGAPQEEAWYHERATLGEAAATKPNVFRLRKATRAAVQNACADADIEFGDPRLTVTVLPRLTPAFCESAFHEVLPDTEVVNLSGETGHLFAGDLTANLNYLCTKRSLAPGEYALVINVGVGLTATAIVVRGEE
ncbi:hypothetical protein OG225_38620 [Nocardia sp. NBC_01377]|uniref:hypothetical protein n=1 Tax=Nocardia sp. NBC_01377 TaxID=2903595 RepID=UPI00325242EB